MKSAQNSSPETWPGSERRLSGDERGDEALAEIGGSYNMSGWTISRLTAQRGKSMTKCVYCRADFPEITSDHVIASSWYPPITPSTVQRLTVPSCKSCNNRYSAIERYALLRLAACANPQIPASQGVWERASRALDVEAAKSAFDRVHRQDAREAFYRDTEEIDNLPAEGVLPSFLSNYYEAGSRTAVHIQRHKLNDLIKKWSLGIHYHLWKNPASQQAEITAIHLSDDDAADAFQETMECWGTIDLGPEIQISYLSGGEENDRCSIYKFTIWGQFTAYGTIVDADLHARRN